MSEILGLDEKFSYAPTDFVRDTRPISKKISDALKTPNTAFLVLAVLGLFALISIRFNDIFFVIAILYFLWFRSKKGTLPLNLPVQAHCKDPKENGGMAAGIFYLGSDHKKQELWINNSDARTHFLILGTTGSGKTEGLLSFSSNALSWGSGFLYTDGKGDSSLWGKIYSLARKFGRDDDILMLNFMTGNVEGSSVSNTMNPFSHGSSAGLTELLVGLMDDPGKEGDMWKGRAMGLVGAIMIVLVELRDKGKLLLDIRAIQMHLSLEKITELYLDPNGQYELSERSRGALKAYLDSLPGFEWNEARAGRPQSSTTNDQHGYLTMQFTRIMGSLSDTYGYIFSTELGDIDLYDVVVNRRLLVVLLPALEKSEDELANLGKIVVASLKSMMATTLGADVEGKWKEVIDTKPTNSSTPFIAILDEVGYYTVPGMAVMAAQARSLGFCMVYAAQDLAAMKKRSEKEAESIVANTNFKIFMKLEDPDSSKEMFKKAAGGMLVTETSGFQMEKEQMTMNYYDTRNASVRERSRADFISLKNLKPGQCYVLFAGKMYRTTMFYANPPQTDDLRINRMIPVRYPDLGALGAGAVDNVIERLKDENYTAADAEAGQPTTGEIAAATKVMAKYTNLPLIKRSCAALAAVAKYIAGEELFGEGAAKASIDDDGASHDADNIDDFNLGDDTMGDIPETGTGDEIDEDLFARLWGSVSNDVVAGIQALQEASVGDVTDNEGAVRAVANAANSTLQYPEGEPPPPQIEQTVLDAIYGLRDALAHGVSEGDVSEDGAIIKEGSANDAADNQASSDIPEMDLDGNIENFGDDDDWEIDIPEEGSNTAENDTAESTVSDDDDDDDDDWAIEESLEDDKAT